MSNRKYPSHQGISRASNPRTLPRSSFARTKNPSISPYFNTDDSKPSGDEKNGNQKIAPLSIHLTNDLPALGITPADSVVGGGLRDFLPHVKDGLKNTKKLGPAADPDMEALLALKPSAIYMDEEYGGKELDKFKKIAPVHVFNLDEGTWRDHLKKIGKLVNREKQANELVEDYEKETKEVKGLIKQELGKNSRAMAIRVTAKELRVFGTARPVGRILFDDLGLTPANGDKKVDASHIK